MLYLALKYLHIIGAAVLLGTGAGIAFFMLAAHIEGKPNVIAGVARIVVIADFIFTATAVVAQPITGVLLAVQAGYSMREGWIVWSIVLYLFTGAFWLPVVWMQIRYKSGCIRHSSSRRVSSHLLALVRLWSSRVRRSRHHILVDDCPSPNHIQLETDPSRLPEKMFRRHKRP